MNRFPVIRRLLSLCVALMLVCSCTALSESQSEAELLEYISAAERMPLAEALKLVRGRAFEDPQLAELSQTCEALALREGLFIQEGRSAKGKVYTATVEFYLNKGAPYCSVDYTNYGGTISDAPVEYAEDGGLVTHPEGQFFSRTHTFTIKLGEETLGVQWADMDEYTLTRSSGNVSEYANDPIPFEERELYQTVVDLVKKMLGDVRHQYTYNEEEKTFYVYVTMGQNLRTLLLTQSARYKETWDSILEGFVDITLRISTAITLEIRDGFGDFTDAHCTAMFVDSLNAQMAYDPKEALAIVKDGKITYNLLTDSNRNSSAAAPRSYSSGHTPTIGEKNALRSAQSYLKVSAFSRDGLIKQLKYEGYSQREAEYAVDHCGADWYAQAVKSAKTYLELMAFSRSGLIKQLEYEGFTYDQAVYGVTQNGF